MNKRLMKMMRHIGMCSVAAGLVLATTTAGFARMDVRQMTCAEAKQLVQTQRAIVLTLTATTYDRIVRNELFCAWQTVGEDVYAKTRDAEKCMIGQRCVIGDRFGVEDDF